MKSNSKLLFVVCIILLTINSVYPLNSLLLKTNKPEEAKTSFWANYELNWKNTNHFNTNPYWNQEETFSIIETSSGNTVTISNRKISSSSNDSYQKSNGKNFPSKSESGTILWKGFRFENLNIPSNAVITDVKFTQIGYKHGNTTAVVKAESVKAPNIYNDDKNYLSTISTTTKSVNWSIPSLSNGDVLTTPNLKDIVQEVVNNNSGLTHLSLIVSAPKKWECWNYDDGSSSYYPKINITYSVATPEVVNDSATTDAEEAIVIDVFDNDSNIPSSGALTITTQPNNGSVTVTDPNNTTSYPSDDVVTYTPDANFSGSDSFKYQVCDGSNICNSATVVVNVNATIDQCDASASGNIDTDGDNISDICDLDDDNDGILDTDEACDSPDVANSTSGSGIYQDRLYFFNWTGSDFTNGLQNGDEQTFTLNNGLIITASFSNVLNGSTYKPNDMDTYSASVLHQLYNTPESKEALYGNDGKDTSFTVNFKATKNGEAYPLDLLALDAESTYPGAEHIKFTTNGDSWLPFEIEGTGGVWSGANTNVIKVINSETAGGNTIWYSYGATQIDIDINAGGREAVAFGIYLRCDSDNDGIPNDRDLDSDNDGCPDALEGGNNYTYSSLNNSMLTGSVNSDGIPIIAGTNGQTIGTSQDNTKQADECDPCNSNSSFFSDNDGDNIGDICDLDDDNDGILDVDECNSQLNTNFIPINSTSPVNTTIDNITITAEWDSNYTAKSRNENYTVFNQNGDGSFSPIIFSFNTPVNGLNFSIYDIDINEFSRISLFDLDNNKIELKSSYFSLGSNIKEQSIGMYTGTITSSTFILDENQRIDVSIPESISIGKIKLEFRENANGSRNFATSKLVFKSETCVTDSDNDGILDYLDTDSDNDGCPDATEGSNNLTTSATLNGGSNGGSSANLGLVVNENGIPTSAAATPTTGQNNVAGVITATQITVTSIADKSYTIGDNVTITAIATGKNTTTFNAGNPDYDAGSSITLSYKWYKNLDPDTILSSTKTLTLESITLAEAGNYTLAIIGENNSCPEEVSFKISLNTLPTASNDIVTLNEDTSISINILSNDSFGNDGPNSGSISITSATSVKGGTVVVNNNSTPADPTDDTISYTPLTNFNGTDTFTYSISDADGDTSTATVTVTVTAVNDTPTATADIITVSEDSTANTINILSNDSFGGDGTLTSSSIIYDQTSTKGGAITVDTNSTNTDVTDDTLAYTPHANFNGIDTFTYTITDANGDTSTATVTVTVTAVNDTPTATDDSLAVLEDSSNNSINVTTNDDFGGDGTSNSAITISSNTTTQNGTIAVDDNSTASDPSDDKITYTPAANFNGTDTFTYTITDADGDTHTATVTVNVSASGKTYNPAAAAECFNIFTKNHLTLTSGNTVGSVAVDGQFTINGNYNIASEECGCFVINDTKIGLLVNGFVNYSSDNHILNINNSLEYVKIGNGQNSTAWYQNPNNEFTGIRITPNSNYEASSYINLTAKADEINVSSNHNPVFENSIIDFVSAFQQLRTNSRSLAEELSNVEILNTDNETIDNVNLPSEISINLSNSVNYLNIDAEDLNNVETINFNQKPNKDLVLIINVETLATFNWNVWEQKGLSASESPYILYNFTKARDININGDKEIFGTILSPYARVFKSENKADITGQVISQEFSHDGGEIKCAAFEGLIYSPEDEEIAPTSDFTINNINQCFEDNQFIFTNTSNTGDSKQPTAEISYSWNFGDNTSSSLMEPTKTYDEPGSYDVVLTTTNAYGSNTKTTQVVVIENITADVVESNNIKDEEAGTITKEFTLNNHTDFTSFSWSLDGFDTSSFDNQKVISFNFTEEGEHTLVLTTINNGCSNTTNESITITSDEVSTGNDGGLESESLGDVLTKRYLQRKMQSIPTIFKKTNNILYSKSKLVKKQPQKKSADLTMLEMFPDELIVGDVAHVTSPTDILDFTIADEVLSVDFSIDEKTIGVVLGVKTLDQIYNHTKATCDRLRGAEILNVNTVEIDGYNFLKQAIQQRSGVIEHAISFAVGKNTADDFYTIQTNWYVFDYTASNEVFNFQVWASEPANTEKMVKDILANLNNYKLVEQNERQKTPRTFATKVSRNADKLVIDFKSLKESQNLEISIDEKLNETATELNSRYLPVNTELKQSLTLNVNDGYEYDGDVTFDGEVQDAFYHADGNWGLDYDKRYTTVSDYLVTNNLDREYQEDELPINRNVQVKAYSEYDYLALYKALLPGNISADYSEYNYLAFKAKGVGRTRLTLIKSSIENWQEQYTVDVVLTDEEKTFFIPFDSFTSTAATDKIVADDLTTISFTYIAVDAGTNDLDMAVSDVKFTKTNTVLNVDEFITPKQNEFFAYPNPSKGNVNCTIFSDNSTKAKVTLFDITGKTVYEGDVDLSAGKNELKFNFKTTSGVLFLKINSSQINYGTSKIVFK